MLAMEQAGFISHQEKLERLGVHYEISERTQTPILDACPLVLDCRVDRIVEEDGICHILPRFLSDLLPQNSWMKRDILKINCLPQPISWEMDISAFIAIWTSV